MRSMTEPTAREQIQAHFEDREAQFDPWVDPHAASDDSVIAAVAQYEDQFSDPREEDETEDEYLERLGTDARTWIEEHASDKLDDMILSADVSVSVSIRIDLSTGGPGDYLTADLESGSSYFLLDNVRYHFAPWFDHADIHVPESSPLYALVARYASLYDGMSTSEIEEINNR
jgi:hypothetical protein